MRPINRWISLAGIATATMLFAAACSSAAATPAASVLGATATPAAMSETPMAPTAVTIGTATSPSLGSYLTGPTGLTLYIFKSDTADTSTCTGTCATNWPALTATAGATVTPPAGATGTFSLITRPDGTMQVAYDHQPLYYFHGDSAAGDTNGQGVLGKWFVAPLASAMSSMAPESMAPESMAPSAAPSTPTGY